MNLNGFTFRRKARYLTIWKVVAWTILLTLFIFVILPISLLSTITNDQLHLLQFGNEISFHMRSVPILWWKTDSSSWPFLFSVIIVGGLHLSVIIDLIIALVFCLGYREKQSNRPPLQRADPEMGPEHVAKQAAPRERNCGAIMGAVVVAIFEIFTGFITMAGLIYPLLNISLHVIIAIFIHADITFPWVVVISYLIFHIINTYSEAKKPFYHLKLIMYEELLRREELIIAHALPDEIKSKVDIDDSREEIRKSYAATYEKIPRKRLVNLLIVFHRGKKPMVLLDHYLDICDHLVSRVNVIFKSVRSILCHVFLSVFVMAGLGLYQVNVARPYNLYQGIAAGATLSVVLFGPYFYNKWNTSEGQVWKEL